MPIKTPTPRARFQSPADVKKAQDRQGLMIMSVCAAAVISGGLAYALLRSPDRDPDTLCQPGRPAPLQSVVVVDRTEKLDTGATALLKQALRHQQGRLKIDERLSLYVFDGSASLPLELLFDKCRPPTGEEVNPMWTTVAHVDAAYTNGFVGAFETAIGEATRMKSAPETALAAALGRLGGHLAYTVKAQRLELTIMSDMGEASAVGSLIGRKPLEATAFREHVVRVIGDRFKDVPVHVVTLPTPSTPAAVAKRLKDTWLKALETVGVRPTWRTL